MTSPFFSARRRLFIRYMGVGSLILLALARPLLLQDEVAFDTLCGVIAAFLEVDVAVGLNSKMGRLPVIWFRVPSTSLNRSECSCLDPC